MTSVLPPWKLELIEKKRKRLEEEKVKEKEKEERINSIPEWKRSILYKRKGVPGFGEDASMYTDDKPSYTNPGNIQNDRIYSQNSLKKSQRSTVDEGRRLYVESNSSNTSQSLQNGDVVGHSFVANSLSPSDKQRENVEQAAELSNLTTCKESMKTTDEEESRVSYEHIRTPSELRKLYELKVVKEKGQDAQSKELSSRKRSSSGSQGDDKVCLSNTTQSHSRETPAEKPESTSSQPNGTLLRDDNDTLIMPAQRKIKSSQDDSLEAPALNEISQQDTIVVDSAYIDEGKKELQNGEISPEVHVEAIRNKFGPSGFFRRRSSSSDNLLNSSHEQTPKTRPSPPNKRWSMVTLPMTSSSDDESVPPPKSPHGSLQRTRSMSDMRVADQHYHEAVYLRHRASVSHDIEHRIHELLHHLSTSDGNTDDEDEDDHHIFNEIEIPKSPSNTEQKEEPQKERKTLWSTSENKESTPTSFLVTQDEDPNNKTLSNQKSHKKFIEESKELTPQNPSKLDHSAKQEEITIIKKEDVFLQNSQLPDNQAALRSVSENNMEDDLPTKGPSVHKLSALFGSSILKGNKKSKENKKPDNKNSNDKQKKKETKAENNNKEDSKSRKFPWSKGNNSKKENKTNQSTDDKKFPFEGTQGLKHIQKNYVERKITGNMTLVIGANTDNYSKFKNTQTYNHLKTPASYPKSSSHSSKQVKNIPESSKKKHTIDYDNDYITIIDVPDTSSHDIEVSAIDMPEAHSPTPVSVIDMPDTQDQRVKVSVIDVPEDSDSDSDSGTSGSYDVNPGESSVFTFEANNSESVDGEDDDDDDDDDIDDGPPVSYVVVFESEIEDVKSCLSSPLRTRKRKGKVVFHPEKLVKVHDYPSEQCLQSHFDEMEREKGGLAKYQPSALKNVNLSVDSLKSRESTQAKDLNSNDEKNDNETKLTYLDDGEGFSSSSSSSGALLF